MFAIVLVELYVGVVWFTFISLYQLRLGHDRAVSGSLEGYIIHMCLIANWIYIDM